jgi:parvulin-like peptidyl-prolyl isomerase
MFKDLAGNTPAQAYDFGSPRTAVVRNQVSAFVGKDDPVDFYRFNLTRSSNVKLSLLNRDQGDADLQLRNEAGQRLFTSRLGVGVRDRITADLAAGTYFIRVFPKQGDVQYRLILKIKQIF